MARSTYSGSVPEVSLAPSRVGRVQALPGTSGLPAASTYRSTGPEVCGSGTALFLGAMPLSRMPSGLQAAPSAWKPGCWSRKPRSTTSSARVPSDGQPSGTEPVTWNQTVDHGAPQGVPTGWGV